MAPSLMRAVVAGWCLARSGAWNGAPAVGGGARRRLRSGPGSFSRSPPVASRLGPLMRGTNEYLAEGPGYCVATGTTTKAFARFSGKVAVVTGAAGNIGSACARRFAAEGAHVALIDLCFPPDQTLFADLRRDYPHQRFEAFECDVADGDKVESTVRAVTAAFAPWKVDYLFNNAGIQGDFAPTAAYDGADLARVLAVNVAGAFHVLQAVAKVMEGGAVVQTASMAAHGAPPNMVAYASSKAAVLAMTRVAAVDLAPANVRVNSVSPAFIGPGAMWTRQIELQAAVGSVYYDPDPNAVARQMLDTPAMKRYGSIDEVVGPVMFLFSDDASYLTGVDVEITGGIL